MLPWSADHYLADGRHDPAERLRDAARRLRRRSCSARSAIRACPTTGTRATSCSARGSSSTSTSTTGRCGCSTIGCARSRIAARKDVNFVVFRENTEGLYVSIGGRFKAGTPDEIAIQEEINTYKGVDRIIRHAFEYARAHGPDHGLHGRQEQRDDAGARALAARVQGGRGRVSRRSSATHMYIDALAMFADQGPGAVSRSSSPTTCSATSSRTSAARCRAAWAWPRRATFIPAGRRCSSRCTDRRRRSRARTSRIRWARSCRPR